MTNQSFEVMNKSSRFTTPSSNSFLKTKPIYILKISVPEKLIFDNIPKNQFMTAHYR